MENEILRGICLTCANARGCTFPRSEQPALTCDEFDGYDGRAFTAVGAGAAECSGRGWNPRVMEPVYTGPRGLCRNCENMKDCLFPKGEVGVWLCEEYR